MNQNSKLPQTSINVLEHRTVLETRAKNAGKRTYSSYEVRTRLGLASKK